ncbi:MAG: Fic family protein [Saprospiraceae bacterium]|nr:Fic family protein [Saprospiraceae bacterium]
MNLTEQLQRLDERKQQLDILRQKLDNDRIREAQNVEFLYESNRIEGNTLTLRETHMVVNEGLTIGGKSLREHLEAINHKEAILLVEDLVARKVDISEYLLKQIHALVLHGIDHDNAGRYRQVSVLISGSKHVPPQPYLAAPLMEDYFAFYDTNKNTMHPVVLAAEMHERLVSIHPFIDGNGRTSRLVMNLILLQHAYPLAIIAGDYDTRMRYYDALEKAQEEPDKATFVGFVVDKVEMAVERYLGLLS